MEPKRSLPHSKVAAAFPYPKPAQSSQVSTHHIGGWVGPSGQSGWMWKILPLPGFNPWTVQPIASRYTDSAIPAPNTIYDWKYISINYLTILIVVLSIFHESVKENQLMLKGVVSNLLCSLHPRHLSASKCHPQGVTCSFFKLLQS
jgi:hypothetical protein